MIRLMALAVVAVVCGPWAFAGSVIYVSKLGDDSDGSSWAKGFRTIQRALDAIPDGGGGHRIRIRPDTYMEANLFPAFAGAEGNYNTLEADFTGTMGSNGAGYAVIDSSAPDKGLQSVDWWSPFKANPEFSGIGWDRWFVRHIYATGGDAGLFWDFPPKIEPFSVVVEDSVGVGRAFGGGAAHFLPREKEPIVFRRCQLWCLDWWGDAAGAYVRAENESMQERPDITFEDCTLVGPDNALQSGNPTYSSYSRVKLTNCRLVSLNYSQPRGTPGTGIIFATIKGEFLHVDLEDCTLMGYKVFGAGEGEVGYSVAGSVRAYVQYEQEMPEGIVRLGHWPVETFQQIVPPMPAATVALVKDPRFVMREMCEVSPTYLSNERVMMECVRPASGGEVQDYYLLFRDELTDHELNRFAEGYGLASAFSYNGAMYVFASRFEGGDWNDVTMFHSTDLSTWDSKVVIQQENEHLFNSSVCADASGFVMAYESNDPAYPAFTIKFARSTDLNEWTKVNGAVFGTDRYTACPCIRFVNGYYYMFYLEHRSPRWFFETYVARSRDLVTWEVSGKNPVLTPALEDEGVNASDVDILDWQGKTYVYYCVGDQRTWANVKLATFDGPLAEFCEAWY